MKTRYLFITALALLSITVTDGIINRFTPFTAIGSTIATIFLTIVAYRKATE